MTEDINETIDQFFDCRAAIFEHVGYTEQWRDHPIVDSREMYWSIDHDRDGRIKMSSSREALEHWLVDDDYDVDEDTPKEHREILFDGLTCYAGAYRGAEITAVVIDTNTDGNVLFEVFLNDRELTRPNKTAIRVENVKLTTKHNDVELQDELGQLRDAAHRYVAANIEANPGLRSVTDVVGDPQYRQVAAHNVTVYPGYGAEVVVEHVVTGTFWRALYTMDDDSSTIDRPTEWKEVTSVQTSMLTWETKPKPPAPSATKGEEDEEFGRYRDPGGVEWRIMKEWGEGCYWLERRRDGGAWEVLCDTGSIEKGPSSTDAVKRYAERLSAPPTPYVMDDLGIFRAAEQCLTPKEFTHLKMFYADVEDHLIQRCEGRMIHEITILLSALVARSVPSTTAAKQRLIAAIEWGCL